MTVTNASGASTSGVHESTPPPRQPWNRVDVLVLGGLAAVALVAIVIGFAGATRVQPVAVRAPSLDLA